MKPKLFPAAWVVFTISLAACAPRAGSTAVPENIPAIPETGQTATRPVTGAATAETPLATQTLPVSENLPVTEITSEPLEHEATLMINQDGDLAPHLVDERGRSLYVYMNDTQNSGASACVDDCAVGWPPLTASSAPKAGAGVETSLIGLLIRPNGSSQATYNGRPLYYYNMDTFPGTTNGQAYNGIWFLVSPAGDPIQK